MKVALLPLQIQTTQHARVGGSTRSGTVSSAAMVSVVGALAMSAASKEVRSAMR